MKCVLIGDNRTELVSTLESLLKNWGYQTVSSTETESLMKRLKELKPDLLIMGSALRESKETIELANKIKIPIIYIQNQDTKATSALNKETLSYPVDIFKLFAATQGHLEKTPRRNIRLNVKMPGLYYKEKEVCIAEVLSLSTEGLFLKTGSQIGPVDKIQLILPLIGMQTELEIRGRIVYRIEPTQDNNYIQGLGIEFTDVDTETLQTLQHYVQGLLFNELTERQSAKNAVNTDHLCKHSDLQVLQLTPIS
jgi:Tfp pilus assembly protein PilZ